MSEHKEPIPSRVYNAAVGGHVCGAVDIIDDALGLEQSSINEDVAPMPYNDGNPNGMGRIVLKKTDNFKTVVEAQTNGNTIFVIKYDFTLTDDVTIPSNCVLEFYGGSISNASGNSYTLTGTNTQINAGKKAIFTNIFIAGTWNCPEITSAWFSDATSDNVLKQMFNLSDDIIQNTVTIEVGTYNVSASENKERIIRIKNNTQVILEGTIVLAANSFAHNYIFSCFEKENISISGFGTIIGDAENHGDVTHEHCQGIEIYSSKNVKISDITITKCKGDGICLGGAPVEQIGDFSNAPSNIFIKNVKLNANGRNNISVTFGINVHIENCSSKNAGTINGVSPKSGIDIEVNESYNQTVKDIYICNLVSENEASASIKVQGANGYTYNNINILNCNCNKKIIAHGSNININDCKASIIGFGSDSTNYLENIKVNNCSISRFEVAAYIRNIIISGCKIDVTSEMIYLFYTDGNITENIGELLLKDSIINIASALPISRNPARYITIQNSIINCVDVLESKSEKYVGNTINCEYIKLHSGNGYGCDKYYNNVINTTSNVAVFSFVKESTMQDRTEKFFEIVNNIINNPTAPIMVRDGSALYETSVSALLEAQIYPEQIGDVFGNKLAPLTNFVKRITYKVSNNSGTTRPSNPYKGQMFFDESLSPAKPIYYNGTNWVDATGATV